jgi:hypothetical protein
VTYRRADNPPHRQPTQLRHRFYHEDHPSWLADSFRGIARAVAGRFRWIDLNFVLTVDGYLVNCHWPRPLLHGWYDPKGLIKPTTPVSRMTLAQVRRLRSRTGGYRIHTAQEMLAQAARAGLRGVEFELKPAPGHDVATYSEALAVVGTAEKAGIALVVKTLTRPGTTAAAVRRVAPFHRAGATTLLLPRGTRRVPRTCWGVVDHVRGRVRWTGPIKEKP